MKQLFLDESPRHKLVESIDHLLIQASQHGENQCKNCTGAYNCIPSKWLDWCTVNCEQESKESYLPRACATERENNLLTFLPKLQQVRLKNSSRQQRRQFRSITKKLLQQDKSFFSNRQIWQRMQMNVPRQMLSNKSENRSEKQTHTGDWNSAEILITNLNPSIGSRSQNHGHMTKRNIILIFH